MRASTFFSGTQSELGQYRYVQLDVFSVEHRLHNTGDEWMKMNLPHWQLYNKLFWGRSMTSPEEVPREGN